MDYFKYNNSRFKVNIDLKEKFYIITGDSGVGKTGLLASIIKDAEREVSCIDASKTVNVIPNMATFKNLEFVNDHIYIADENVAARVIEAVRGINCFCILITRKYPKHINTSIESRLEARRFSNGLTVVMQKYKFCKRLLKDYKPDLILTEDSGYGYLFIKECVDIKTVSAEGKSNIRKKLTNVECKDICVVLDRGGIGDCIAGIYRECQRLQKKGITVVFLAPVCFEHVLLTSKYFKYNEDVYKYFDKTFESTEAYCEEELYRLTKDTVLECSHKLNRLSKCWYTDCSKCTKSDCSFRVTESKLEYVLQDTVYAALLKFKE